MSLDLGCCRPQPSPAAKVWGTMFASGVVIFLCTTLLVANLAQFSTLLIYPFSRHFFHRVNRWLADWWWGLCHKVADLAHTQMVIHEISPVPREENVIVVANHQTSVDVLALFALAHEKRRLGDLKWFVKDGLRWVPGMGFGLMFLGCIFLKRNWTRDRDRIDRTFRHIVNAKAPFWVTMFAEGTRLKSSKQDKSDQMAARYDVRPFKHVLFPATKGFIASAECLRSRLDAVYDVTIHYPDGIPPLWDYWSGFVRRVDMYVTRHPTASLPEDPNELAAWLVERYADKERLLAQLKDTRLS